MVYIDLFRGTCDLPIPHSACLLASCLCYKYNSIIFVSHCILPASLLYLYTRHFCEKIGSCPWIDQKEITHHLRETLNNEIKVPKNFPVQYDLNMLQGYKSLFVLLKKFQLSRKGRSLMTSLWVFDWESQNQH